MLDQDIQEHLNALNEVFNNKAVDKVRSHLMSLYQKIDDLTKSRDLWKNRLMESQKNDLR